MSVPSPGSAVALSRTTIPPAAGLTRKGSSGRATAPARIVHLGLGNFFRAHQAWYTDRAEDAAHWGIAAFTGHSAALPQALAAQDGLYTLIVRGPQEDTAEVVASLSRAYAGTDHAAWSRWLADPAVAVVTLTVTEAGYGRGPDGTLNLDSSPLQTDLAALRRGDPASMTTVAGRLVAGFVARRRGDGGPLTVVSCDNLPGNGDVIRTVVTELADLLDPTLSEWITTTASFVTTMVDRITPTVTPSDPATALALAGHVDAAPVVTEPFTEWVLSGDFPGGRPRWETAGARFVDDVTPFEERKLRLLNGGHSLLAYAGSVRGLRTISQAVNDETCRNWLTSYWAEATPFLSLPADEIAAYQTDLLARFANPRMEHQLAQIAVDGSLKIPVRLLPTIREARSRNQLPEASLRAIAAWIAYLRDPGTQVRDTAADTFIPLAHGALRRAVPAVMKVLAPDLVDDREVVRAVTDLTGVVSR